MIRLYKPTTSARRKTSVTDYALLTTKKPQKNMTRVIGKNAGRDKSGQISIRHQGGGEKRKYRLITSLDKFLEKTAKVVQIEYDPNRSSFIVLIEFNDGTKAYILAWDKVKIGDEVVAKDKVDIKKGNRCKIKNIKNGVGIYDIEIQPNQQGRLVRSAGTSATIVAKEGKWAHIKLPSSEIRKININCFASIGQVSNVTHSAVRIGKAGRKRHMGIRPSVRGKVMSPAAHPHGGGEGVNPIGLKYPKTPWGKHAMGVRTRKKNKYSANMIIRRRKK